MLQIHGNTFVLLADKSLSLIDRGMQAISHSQSLMNIRRFFTIKGKQMAHTSSHAERGNKVCKCVTPNLDEHEMSKAYVI